MDVTPSMQFDAPQGCSSYTDDIEALTAASWGEEGEGGGQAHVIDLPYVWYSGAAVNELQEPA